MICFRCGERGHIKFQCMQYKVRPCLHFERGECKDLNCAFAHGEGELRCPWRMKCVRVIKRRGELVCIGCGQWGHTFRKCHNAHAPLVPTSGVREASPLRRNPILVGSSHMSSARSMPNPA